jgi:hypothetical protein
MVSVVVLGELEHSLLTDSSITAGFDANKTQG